MSGIGYSVSEALLPSLVIALLAFFSWRASWVFWAMVLLLVMPLLILRLLRGHEQRHQAYLDAYAAEHNEQAAPDTPTATTSTTSHRPRRRHWTRAEVIRDPLFYLYLPAITTLPVLFTGFMFHQVHLVEEKGWPLALWGGLYVLYALTTTVMKLLAGVLIDRFSAMVMAPLMSLPLALGLLILASSDHVLAAVVFMALLGVSTGFYSTMIAPFFSEKYGNRHLGAIKSLATAVMVFASAIAPVIMGWLIDRGTAMNSMALGGVLYILIASAMAAWAWQLHQRSLPPPALQV
ncbi:MAG: MFS transporter [Thiolinea sp.]